MILSGIVAVFVERLYDAKLRSSVIRRSAVGCGSLFGAFQITQNTLIGMQNEREVEAILAQEK